MALVVIILSLFSVAVGVLGLIAPERLVGFVRLWQTPLGLYSAAALRLVLGLALFLAAPPSKAPGVLRVAGVIIIVAGLATPFVGVERFRKHIEWWSARGSAFVRAWAFFALAVGLLLVYAVAP